MAQVRILKIHTTGGGVEHQPAADDLTMLSFTVNGGGPVLSATGLDLNNQDLSDVSDIDFNDPAVSTIEQTAGALIIDNIMAKERENLMATTGGISFPVITDDAGEVDAFRVPALAGVPTASPTTGGAGHMVYDSSNEHMYVWTGSAWDNMNTVDSTNNIKNMFVAAVNIAIRDVVYISAADNVTPCDNDSDVASYAIGFATAAALATDPVEIQSAGILGGFSGLTPGAPYFLDGTAGLITATLPPGNSGKNIVRVGFAKSATELNIQIQYLNKRGT